MRIAVWHCLPSGGGKRALYDHVRGLVSRGHYVESWCPPVADQSFLPLSDIVKENIVPLPIGGRYTWRNALGKMTGGATKTPTLLKLMDEHTRQCADEINQGDFDILLSGSSIIFAVTPIARYVGIPSVLYLQEPSRRLYEALPLLPWPAMPRSPGRDFLRVPKSLQDKLKVHALRLQAREELQNVKAYTRVLCNSYYSRESILRAYGVEAKVCYLGIDTERYIDRGTPRSNTIVGIGAFIRSKRVEVAIEAVARLSTPRPNLCWIGNVVDKTYLKELVSLARERHISFDPKVSISHDNVVNILNEAIAMIYAPRLEPFGYAPLEGAACGVPVVAKAEGGVRETVLTGETGFLVDDDISLTSALQRLLEDPVMARDMRIAARNNVESTWALTDAIERLEAHLEEVAKAWPR